ncbi:hypothetical protein [Pseudochelatococcus contaminans]|uniref:Uncharacterized protein n=1 Tax=Pseudochelatococcus contaminans TaxID=1538103 RepID=A0A7W5Z2R5_9HYPH|nr:hypothetical protein [Pseudochelatococcus contaminans]MBB3809048.1 hypothetical protein [Pseudochelatococcus contaminans]
MTKREITAGEIRPFDCEVSRLSCLKAIFPANLGSLDVYGHHLLTVHRALALMKAFDDTFVYNSCIASKAPKVVRLSRRAFYRNGERS